MYKIPIGYGVLGICNSFEYINVNIFYLRKVNKSELTMI